VKYGIEPQLFAKEFFPHHCRWAFSPFHKDLIAHHRSMQLDDLEIRRGGRLAIAAPRGSAKTTLCSLILLLHAIVHRRERYVVIISATLKQAAQRLRNLRNEIASNDRLREMYDIELDRKGEFRAHSIQVNEVQVDAFGSGAEIRGISSGPWRPTKIILDDVEDSEGVESSAQREKLLDWFNEVVENLGDRYTNLVFIGTILHPESLLSTVLKRPDFAGRVYRSIEAFSPRDDLWAEWRRRYVDLGNPRRVATARRFYNQHSDAMIEGTQVLWPEKEDYYDLITQLVTRGRRAFYQEKQNEPLGRETALFDPAVVRRFRREGDALCLLASTAGGDPWKPAEDNAEHEQWKDRNGKETRRVPLETLRIVGFLDPALGKGSGAPGRSGRGDFAALAVVGTPGDGSVYLLELWARRASPTEQIRILFDAHEHWTFAHFGVEGNCFQELLQHPLEAEREKRRREGQAWDLPMEMVTHRRNKVERIAALEPFLANGWLSVSDSLPEEFWRELQAFPGGDHDDALDALEGAVTLARRYSDARRSSSRARNATARLPGGLGEF